MIKIGVLGAGHLGRIHIRLLKNIPDFEIWAGIPAKKIAERE